MDLITGLKRKSHFTSRQHRAIYQKIIGPDSYILEGGENLELELQSNNQVAIRSGMLCHHGAIAEVPDNTYDVVHLNNGSQGMKRKDLIVCRYTKNAETEVEEMAFTVVQGEPSETTPAVPEHISGNMQAGDLVDECPFAVVEFEGIQVVSVTPLLSVLGGSLAELNDNKLEFGSYETVSTPYTAPVDGFLFVNFNPANSSVDVSVRTYDDSAGSSLVGYQRSQAGIQTTYTVPVIKGHTYNTTYQSGTLRCRFVPATKS